MGAEAGQPVAPTGERVVRAEFTGSAREYFRIWIVNLFFTLISLGIYSAWAKVRKKRYFYGSTRFDGDTFDYFASPKAILNGRIVAVALLLVYAFATELYPDSIWVFWGLLAVMIPWLLVRALSFNARNSAYRGLRFDFLASTGQTAKKYFGLVLLVIVTLGIAMPWFIARYKSFILSHHAFGSSRLGCDIAGREVFGIYIRGFFLLLLLLIPAGGLMAAGAFAMAKLPESVAWAAIALPLAIIYAAYAVVYAYTEARTTNLQWNSTHGPGVRFSSTLSARKLAWIYIGNLIGAAGTAGLLIPWAVVRTLRYRLENFSMIVADEGDHEASPALARVAATGQEVGDIFNLDIGV
jgi:uncharacterized membrane protein YjgN (DUF898 family)